MVDWVHSITQPFSGTKNILNFLVLAVLNAFWFLLLPAVIVNGYLVRFVQNVYQAKKELPEWPTFEWHEWWYMLKHGFFFTLISFIYLAVPFVIAYFGAAGTLPLWFVLLAFLLFFVLIFILPMALVYYATTENIWQAFNFPEIFSAIFKKIVPYLLACLLWFIFFVLAIFLGNYLSYFSGLVLVYPTMFILNACAQILAEEQ